MDSEIVSRRARIVAKTAAIMVGAMGLCTLGLILAIIWQVFQQEKGGNIFFFIFLVPGIVLGGYCLFAAYRMWLNISLENARRISFAGSIAAGFMFIGPLIYILPRGTVWQGFTTVAAMSLAGVFFLMLNKSLIRWLGLPYEMDWVRREKSAKRFFGWLAVFLWSACGQIWIEVWEPRVSNELWSPVVIFGSMILAFLFYKICVGIALLKKPKAEQVLGVKTRSAISEDYGMERKNAKIKI